MMPNIWKNNEKSKEVEALQQQMEALEQKLSELSSKLESALDNASWKDKHETLQNQFSEFIQGINMKYIF